VPAAYLAVTSISRPGATASSSAGARRRRRGGGGGKAELLHRAARTARSISFPTAGQDKHRREHDPNADHAPPSSEGYRARRARARDGGRSRQPVALTPILDGRCVCAGKRRLGGLVVEALWASPVQPGRRRDAFLLEERRVSRWNPPAGLHAVPSRARQRPPLDCWTRAGSYASPAANTTLMDQRALDIAPRSSIPTSGCTSPPTRPDWTFVHAGVVRGSDGRALCFLGRAFRASRRCEGASQTGGGLLTRTITQCLTSSGHVEPISEAVANAHGTGGRGPRASPFSVASRATRGKAEVGVQDTRESRGRRRRESLGIRPGERMATHPSSRPGHGRGRVLARQRALGLSSTTRVAPRVLDAERSEESDPNAFDGAIEAEAKGRSQERAASRNASAADDLSCGPGQRARC